MAITYNDIATMRHTFHLQVGVNPDILLVPNEKWHELMNNHWIMSYMKFPSEGNYILMGMKIIPNDYGIFDVACTKGNLNGNL